MQKLILHDLRVTYASSTLLESSIPLTPLPLFTTWFNEARELLVGWEVNGMTLSTLVNKQGTWHSNSRIVLLKQADEHGFTFFTNYESDKSKELMENPNCSLVFWWGDRSVRVQGKAEKLSDRENDAYFAVRPFESKLGAWASNQSSPLPNRQALDDAYEAMTKKYSPEDFIPRPNWGGWRIVPEQIEFWQGRPSRLHDRIVYQREGQNWKIVRLNP